MTKKCTKQFLSKFPTTTTDIEKGKAHIFSVCIDDVIQNLRKFTKNKLKTAPPSYAPGVSLPPAATWRTHGKCPKIDVGAARLQPIGKVGLARFPVWRELLVNSCRDHFEHQWGWCTRTSIAVKGILL